MATKAELQRRIAVLEAQVAALTAQRDTLAVENASLVTTNAALTEQVNTLTAERDRLRSEVSRLTADIIRLQGEVAVLQAALDACQNPPPPPPPPPAAAVWGSSTGAHTFDWFTQQAGQPLECRRSYEQGIPASFMRESTGADVGRCASVTSLAFDPPQAPSSRAALEAYYRTIPGDHLAFCIVSHEPENPDKNIAPADYRAQQQIVREILDRVNADRDVPLRFGGNWMSYSFRVGRDMEPMFPGDEVWDFLALDGYSARTSDGRWTGNSPATVFDKGAAYVASKGLRFAIAECGVDVLATEVQRIAWIDACQNYTKAKDPAFWCYWDGSFGNYYLNTADEAKAVVFHP